MISYLAILHFSDFLFCDFLLFYLGVREIMGPPIGTPGNVLISRRDSDKRKLIIFIWVACRKTDPRFTDSDF